MQFYRIQCVLREVQETRSSRKEKKEEAARIQALTAEYNEKQDEIFFFVEDCDEENVNIGAISLKAIDPHNRVKPFLEFIGLQSKEHHADEVTFSTLRAMLGKASRHDYIEDDDEVLEQFELSAIERGLRYGENLLTEAHTKQKLLALAEKYFVEETFTPELERIFAGKSIAAAIGHPVHYMLQSDDRDTRREVYRGLLHALYTCGRLANRRYAYLDFRPGENYSHAAYEALYKSCEGGAVVARYVLDEGEEEGECATDTHEMIAHICEVAKRHRNRVLTVICLPRSCNSLKSRFYENLGTVSVIEIREDLIAYERAQATLAQMARAQHVRVDKRLRGALDAKKSYLAAELRDIFDIWYNEKLKTSIYPQYKEIAPANKDVAKAKPRGSAYEELMEMIGLSEAKAVIVKALNYYKIQKLYEQKGIRRENPAMHMVFTGNPGTAKTSVARLFARIMRENGLISNGKLVEVGRADLVGKYVGWTAQVVQEKFKAAKGGVLFIDEAYSLVDGHKGSYGDEAINTIVQEMENNRADVVVIFAGYPAQMEEFLQKNPGLRSRVAFHVPFADYNSDELCGIARLISKKDGMQIEETALKKLASVFDAARKNSDFGNGRYVRNLFEQAKMNQATRLLAKDFDEITVKEITTITAEDIEMPAGAKTDKRKVGFL